MKKQNRLISLLTVTFFLCNQIAAEAALYSPQFHLRTRSAGDGGSKGPTVTALQNDLTGSTTSLDGGKKSRIPERIQEIGIIAMILAGLGLGVPFLTKQGILSQRGAPSVKVASPPGSIAVHPPTFYHDAFYSYYFNNSWGAITTVLPDMRDIVQKPLKGTAQEQTAELIRRIRKHEWNDEDQKWMKAVAGVVNEQIEQNGGELPVYVYREQGVQAEKRFVSVTSGSWSALKSANPIVAFGNAAWLIRSAQGDSARDGGAKAAEPEHLFSRREVMLSLFRFAPFEAARIKVNEVSPGLKLVERTGAVLIDEELLRDPSLVERLQSWPRRIPLVLVSRSGRWEEMLRTIKIASQSIQRLNPDRFSLVITPQTKGITDINDAKNVKEVAELETASEIAAYAIDRQRLDAYQSALPAAYGIIYEFPGEHSQQVTLGAPAFNDLLRYLALSREEQLRQLAALRRIQIIRPQEVTGDVGQYLLSYDAAIRGL